MPIDQMRISAHDRPIGECVSRILTDEGQWDALESPWNELFDASPSAGAPSRFAWLREWWSAYGEAYGRGGLRIIVIEEAGRLVGALPLYRSAPAGAMRLRTLRFLSTGEAESEETCPNYLDLLCVPGREAACVGEIERLVRNEPLLRADRIELCEIPAESPLLSLAERCGDRLRCDLIRRGETCIADLGGGFDQYLQTLSNATRKECRRLLNGAERAVAEIELAQSEQQVEEFFGQLVDLHQRRWQAEGRSGCFASERFARFHRNLARRLVPSGEAVLARLAIRGESLAVIYGMLAQDKFDCYIQGATLDEVSGLRSAGTTAHLLLKSRLAAGGVRYYDYLLAARPSYKHRFAPGGRGLVRLVARRRGWRNWVGQTVDRVASVGAGIRRRIGASSRAVAGTAGEGR